MAPLCPPSTTWVARSLGPGESKGGEESNGKLPHKAVCQEQSGPYPWFPNAWTKRGTPFTLTDESVLNLAVTFSLIYRLY
ncbi:hypothetical protein PoB_002383200 [Plakobranchus ocellatus]|uniref:Uncharacterized protein n=1 Tax=Plakobranchus ocellatus TaxID=259542 RepID=A0AAV3ZS17_9GAST|nr:hypothetical protein PoB_002383200 [Plakobranchus ocellatus]